ncbi:hypothetical protein T439DRAFT_379548 [Meredithblackwellia eburnea MCA 4105]
MSRPPILPASNSGITEKNNGDRVVERSRRPDGTFRKEIKIRPGFTPEEDVKRYRSQRMADDEARASTKGRIPGLAPAAAVQAALNGMGMSKAQKKNAKRKEKRKEGAGEDEDGEEETPDSWDADEEGSKPATAANGEKVEPSVTSNSLPPPSPTTEAATATPPPPPPPAPVVEDSKRVKAIKKKIRQAELLKERETLGLYLPPAERAKILTIPDLEAELAKLSVSEKEAEQGAKE